MMKPRFGARSGLPMQARLCKARLLLHLLTAPSRNEQQAGSIMVSGMLVILALLVGTLGLVAIVNGSNLASFGSGESRDAQQVAEAGADQIIATFNQPQNRQLLVAGSTPPNQWSTTNTDLQSPCVSTAGLRPGTTGLPSARAVNFANGQFRNLEDVDQVNQGNRRFVLRSVRYSAGNNGSTDRRSVFRTFRADGTPLSQGGTIPTGTRFNSLLNLDDPDGGNPLRPGTHTGYISLTVEGRLYRPDGTFSTSTITKEFEVVPKCCGGSFGTNDSGGSTDGTATAGDLGADSRFCGIEFGMITGINGGRIFSYSANDRYTRRNLSGQVVDISSILGVVADPSYVWDRRTSRVVGGAQVGCRTFPSACNTAAELEPQTTNRLIDQYAAISAGSPVNCLGSFGNRASIDGRAASCIPIVPLFLSTGLPSIASRYTFNWTAGGNPDIVSRQSVSSGNEQGYPIIRASATEDVNVWLRANGATAVNQITPGPFLEYCNTRYLPGNACASVFNGSQIHTWAVVSRPGPVTGGIGDDFESNSFSGYTANSTPRWPSIWQRSFRTTNGDEVLFQGGAVTFRRTTTTNWNNLTGTTANPSNPAPAIARAVNLYALRTPVFEFTFTPTGTGNFNSESALKLDYSFGSGVTTDQPVQTNNGWVELATITAGGAVTASNGASGPNCSAAAGTFTCRVAFPPESFSNSNRFRHYVKFRLKANSQFITSAQSTTGRIRTVTVDNIAIKSSTTGAAPEYLNWCEFSSSIPDTSTFDGGFHCLGPTIDLIGVDNNLWIDTTDHSVTFYYNRPTDTRGITFTDPLIELSQGALMSNVSCTRGANPLATVPVENCRTLVPENVFNPVGEYDRFNIFGRDTAPANNCSDSGQNNQPCNQVILIGANSSATATNRSRIAGAWFYLPWGYVSFCVNGCGGIPSISAAEFALDDSWNFGGRIWVRTIHNGGQAHFRVPPSASSSLTQLVGAANSSQISYIGWEGIDWVARSSTTSRKGFSLN